jgi:hypothetical protein
MAWQYKDRVATLLLLDMTKAFDRVMSKRLLHNIRKIRISEWVVEFVSGFVSNRTATLCLPVYNIDTFSRQIVIFQGLSSSPYSFTSTMPPLLIPATQ